MACSFRRLGSFLTLTSKLDFHAADRQRPPQGNCGGGLECLHVASPAPVGGGRMLRRVRTPHCGLTGEPDREYAPDQQHLSRGCPMEEATWDRPGTAFRSRFGSPAGRDRHALSMRASFPCSSLPRPKVSPRAGSGHRTHTGHLRLHPPPDPGSHLQPCLAIRDAAPCATIICRPPAGRNRLQAPAAYPGAVHRPSDETGAFACKGILSKPHD